MNIMFPPVTQSPPPLDKIIKQNLEINTKLRPVKPFGWSAFCRTKTYSDRTKGMSTCSEKREKKRCRDYCNEAQQETSAASDNYNYTKPQPDSPD